MSPTGNIGCALCGLRCCGGASGRETETHISMDEAVEVPQERTSECIAQQIVYVPKSQILEETVEVEKPFGKVDMPTVEVSQVEHIDKLADVTVAIQSLADHGSKRQPHRSEQQQHQKVHKDRKEDEKEEVKKGRRNEEVREEERRTGEGEQKRA